MRSTSKLSPFQFTSSKTPAGTPTAAPPKTGCSEPFPESADTPSSPEPAHGMTNADHEHFAAEIRKNGLMSIFPSEQSANPAAVSATTSSTPPSAMSTITGHGLGGDRGPEAFVPQKIEQRTRRFGALRGKENKK